MKEYLKLYQKMREEYYQEWGTYSHPESLQDFEKLNQEIFEEHLKKYNESTDTVLKTKVYVDLLLDKIQYFGYYSAFCEGSFESLNNAIWQSGRTDLLKGSIVHSGMAYTGNILKGIFTCCRKNFPESQSIMFGFLFLLRKKRWTELRNAYKNFVKHTKNKAIPSKKLTNVLL